MCLVCQHLYYEYEPTDISFLHFSAVFVTFFFPTSQIMKTTIHIFGHVQTKQSNEQLPKVMKLNEDVSDHRTHEHYSNSSEKNSGLWG